MDIVVHKAIGFAHGTGRVVFAPSDRVQPVPDAVVALPEFVTAHKAGVFSYWPPIEAAIEEPTWQEGGVAPVLPLQEPLAALRAEEQAPTQSVQPANGKKGRR